MSQKPSSKSTNVWSLKLILCVLFYASAAWFGVNSIWVELPLIVKASPQQWRLPSYLTVVIQVANIAPLLYLLISKYLTTSGGRKIITEQTTIYFILVIDVILSFGLAFTWQNTSIINGYHYSTWLIAINFLIAAADAMTSVTFWPFMASFPQMYMVVFYIGAGMSGFVPSITAMIQGLGQQPYSCLTQKGYSNISSYPGKTKIPIFERNNTRINTTDVTYHTSEPRFSVQVFFVIVASFLFSSLIAYVFLVRIKKRMDIQSTITNTEDKSNKMGMDNVTYDKEGVKDNEGDESIDSISSATTNETRTTSEENIESNDKESNEGNSSKKILPTKTVIFLLLLNGTISCFSNGVLPALQSFACLPYGSNIYHLTLTLSSAINPIACFLYFFVSVSSVKALLAGGVVYAMSAAYTIFIAANSPCPLMNDSTTGGVIVLIVTVFGVGLVNYLKTAIGTILQQQGHKALLWCGVSAQVGSLVGATAMFPLISVYHVFQQSDPCHPCH